MRVLAVANQKGGCGKTTTSINLGASLSFLGKKVLILDLDPQAHSTLGLGINADRLERSIFDVLNPETAFKTTLQDVTVQVEKNLWLAPAQIVLTAIEQQLVGMPKREEKLMAALEPVQKNYDYVLIDCPPNLGLLTFNALRASSEALIPIEPSTFSIHGLDKINETIQMLKDQIRHRVTVHALLTMYDNRNKFSRDMIEQVRLIYGPQILRTVIRNNIRLREAAQAGRPISRFDRHATGFHDYLNLASEMIERGALKQKEEAVSLRAEKEEAVSLRAEEEKLDQMIVSPSAAIKEILDEPEELATDPVLSSGAIEEEEELTESSPASGGGGLSYRIDADEDDSSDAEEEPEEDEDLEDDGTEAEPAQEKTALSDFEARLLGDLKRARATEEARETDELSDALDTNASSAQESRESVETTALVEEKELEEEEEVPAEATGKTRSPLKVIRGIQKYPLKVSGGFLFICKCPEAKTVQIVGDFTKWVAVNMNSPGGKSGFWTRVFSLLPSRYKYKFIVDGEWVNDINNPTYERNPYGGIDSVLDVSG